MSIPEKRPLKEKPFQRYATCRAIVNSKPCDACVPIEGTELVVYCPRCGGILFQASPPESST